MFSVAGIIISGFTICFFATSSSDPAVFRLKYARKSVIMTIKHTLEMFHLHFEFYCVQVEIKSNISFFYNKNKIKIKKKIFENYKAVKDKQDRQMIEKRDQN